MKVLPGLIFLLFLLACINAAGQERIREGDVSVIFPPRVRTQADTALKLYR